MGFGGISPWSLLLILLIVMLIFGTKRLKGVGGDLGSAIKSFKQSMSDGEKEDEQKQLKEDATKVVEGKVKDKEKA
jgi:sec-independent protein translocase protein TatA